MTRLAEQSPDPEVRLHAVYEIAAALSVPKISSVALSSANEPEP
jgi:hypothetical protein